MPTIDLNADLGEGYPWDESLLSLVSSASISCGFHAGDDAAIRKTLQIVKRQGVSLGAHPGYPDRDGFGRREQAMTRDGVTALVLDQVVHLMTLADAEEVLPVRFFKPHGALYNQSQRDPEMARGLAQAALNLGLALFGLPDSEVSKAAMKWEIPYIAEGFADRGYNEDGSLIPRGQPGAILDDPSAVAAQVIRLVDSGRVQTLCLHGDDRRAVKLAHIVRDTLDLRGVTIRGIAT